MIALCPNPYRDIRLEYTRDVMGILNNEGFETCICPVFADAGDKVLPEDLKYSLLKMAAECTLAVVIGGDGTILAVARKLIGSSIPLFGINLGTKGFLCTTDPNEPDCSELLIRAAKGDLLTCSRMMLDVEVFREDKCIFSNYTNRSRQPQFFQTFVAGKGRFTNFPNSILQVYILKALAA